MTEDQKRKRLASSLRDSLENVRRATRQLDRSVSELRQVLSHTARHSDLLDADAAQALKDATKSLASIVGDRT